MNDAEPVDPAQVAAKVKAIVEELARIDFAVIDPYTMPELYSSGVQYQKRQGESLSLVSGVLREGRGDVDDLVAWRIAELRKHGEAATCVVQWVTSGPGTFIQVLVRRADGRTENVIENLARIPFVTKGSLWIELSTGAQHKVIHFDMMPPAKSLAWQSADGKGHGGTLEEFLTTHRPDFRDSSGTPFDSDHVAPAQASVEGLSRPETK